MEGEAGGQTSPPAVENVSNATAELVEGEEAVASQKSDGFSIGFSHAIEVKTI